MMNEINLMLSQAVRLNDPALVQSLLNQGAQINGNVVYASMGYHMTPLQASARSGHIQMMNLLIDNGADVNLSNLKGNTALHYAAAFNYAATALLINKGADLNAFNQWNENPCFWAAQNNQLEILKLLLDKGADGLIGNSDLKTPFAMMTDHDNIEGMQILFALGADLNAVDGDGTSPLSLAVENRNLDAIKWLHDQSVDLNASNNILCALKNKDFDIALLLCSWGSKLNLRKNLELSKELNENLDEIIGLHNIHILEKISGLMHIAAAGYDLIYHAPESAEAQKLVHHVANELFGSILDLNLDQTKLFESLKGKDITQSLLSIYQLAYLHKGYKEVKDQLEINHPEFCSSVVEFINNVRASVDPLINHIITNLYIDQKILNQFFEGKKIRDIDQNISLLKSITQINKEELKINNSDLYRALEAIDPYLQKSITSYQGYKSKSLQYNLFKIGTIGYSQDGNNLAFGIMKNLRLLKDDVFRDFATEYLYDQALESLFADLKVSSLPSEYEPAKSIKIQDELIETAGKFALEE